MVHGIELIVGEYGGCHGGKNGIQIACCYFALQMPTPSVSRGVNMHLYIHVTAKTNDTNACPVLNTLATHILSPSYICSIYKWLLLQHELPSRVMEIWLQVKIQV